MARFRFKKNATGFARASYSEVYDMHTEYGKTTLIGVHTPTTTRWQYFLEGFVKQYKKFRYKGASLSFVPVATLPSDPLQVSYEAGEPTIDPRDLMNPIIHCGMRGQSMGNYLDEIFNMNISHALNSLDVADVTSDTAVFDLEQAYYSALMSPSFRKSHPQQGFRKSGLHPMVYQMTTNMPFNYASGDTSLSGTIDFNDSSLPTLGNVAPDIVTASDPVATDATNESLYTNLLYQRFKEHPLTANPNDSYYAQFFTNKLTSLGWLDTIQRFTDNYLGTANVTTANRFTTLPKVYMYFIMLPPAYKTEMYYRVIVRHYFEFKGFRTTSQPFAYFSGHEGAYDGVIENTPVSQAVSEASAMSEVPVASMDIYNGDASLITDGAM